MIEIKGQRFTQSDDGEITYFRRYLCDSEEEAMFGIPAIYLGLGLSAGGGARWEAGKWTRDASYKGFPDGFEPRESQETYELEGEFREEKIENFPDRELLEEEYGAYYDEESNLIQFPETIPTPVAKRMGGLTKSQKKEGPNPLYGLRTYPVFYEIARHGYVRERVPADVHKRKGTVVDRLPSGFDYQGTAQHWWVDAPRLSKSGRFWRITEIYREIDAMPHLIALAQLTAVSK